MDAPDQRLFDSDIAAADFRMNADKGFWGMAEPGVVPANLAWPMRILWVSAAQRPRAPVRFYFQLDLKGYRAASPTGTLWDPERREKLALERWPKGKDGSRFAKVFRTDNWQRRHQALYHPYDRVAAQTHKGWAKEQPQLIWTSEHTIVDFLEEFRSLLQGSDYVGV